MSIELAPAGDLAAGAASLPEGLRVVRLSPHSDARGDFIELFREEWSLGPAPVQWNLARSASNVLRGVHTHADHCDFLTMAEGAMILGLRDSRKASPTFGQVIMTRLSSDDPCLVVIPPGVSHGFYFPDGGMHVYGVSAYFQKPEEAICRWDDPDLGMAWPCRTPLLSEKDAQGGTYAQMLQIMDRREAQA